MNNKKVALIGLVTFILLSLVIVFSWPTISNNFSTFMQKMFPTNDTKTVSTVVKTEGLFTVHANYQGSSIWDYEVTATLPNPCIQVLVDAIVEESYPEKVIISISQSQTSDFCIQTTQEYSYSGSFNASEKAIIEVQTKN